MRSMWKGSISFGLVNIPVSLYKATDEHKTSFRTLHEPCRHPIQYKKWCPACEQEVAYKETVRGYEYAPDNFILITDDDLQELPLPTLRTIEILHFTEKDQIDPLYYHKAYYLGPREFGDKPYKLLAQAMEQANKVAIAKVAFRTSEHLAALQLYQTCLMMNIIHYPQEIRPIDAIPGLAELANAEVTEAEQQMAEKLIAEISSEFRDDYHSNYQTALQSLINTKIENKEIAQPETTPQADNVVNLMEALQQSLNVSKEKQPAPTTPNKEPAEIKGRRRKI